MKARVGIAAIMLLAGVLAARATTATNALPYYADATLTPRWAVDARELDSAHAIGAFRLVDQHGNAATRSTVDGKVYVASFFYSACKTLCPAIREQLARVHAAYAGDSSVMILSHSVTPEADGIAALAHYSHVNGIDDQQWRLLTGSRAEIERLAREKYFVELADTTGNTNGWLRHTETLVLVDGRGHIRGVYDGSLAFEVSQLIADIRTLKDERK